jgi:pimeloyl-ACP methyl ester carboxylesterase
MPAIQAAVAIASGHVSLEGALVVPEGARGIVLFAHGSGSSRKSPRNTYVAKALRAEGLGTLLFDLLTVAEDTDYERRFEIELLSRRLADGVRFVRDDARTRSLAVGLFGASTGAAAALQVAARFAEAVGCVVSRGGRPDLAGSAVLRRVAAPTLFIVGGHDYGVIELNEAAFAELRCTKEMSIVPGATHLFEEPGTLDEVARLAAAWFVRHLAPAA